MATEINIKVSPALHPGNVRVLPGFDPDTAPVVELTEAAFSTAYEGLKSIFAAKEAAAKNPTLNPAAQLLQVDDFAQKKLTAINRAFDSELSRLGKAVASLEQELTQPIKVQASAPFGEEVRKHLKSLPTADRIKAIRDAIDDGDSTIATAALGAPAMLIGLDPKMQSVLLRQWHEKQNPTTSARLKVMQAAKELIETRGGLAQTAVIGAVGYITDEKTKRKIYPAEVRKARDAAEAPFKAA